MNNKFIFWFYFFVGFTSISFSQYKSKLQSIDSLIKKDKLDEVKKKLDNLNKDTLYFSNNSKALYYHLLGRYFEKNDKEDVAFEYFKKASSLYRQEKNFTKLMEEYYNTFLLLNSRKNLKQDAKTYLDKIYQYAIKVKDTNLITKAYFGYALINFNKKGYKKALNYYNKIITINKMNKIHLNLAKAYNNKGAILNNYINDIDSARYYYKKSIIEYKKIGKNKERFATTFNLGLTFLKEKKYPKTIEWLEQADAIPLTKYRKNYKRLLYKKLAETYEKQNDYKNGFYYLKKYNQYKDSVNITKQNIAISDIETKYKALQKEKENLQLKADKQQQQVYLTIILGTFVSSLILGFLFYFNLKHKKEVIEKEKDITEKEKEIQQQKIISLVKEQEILAMDAMLEGQDKERLRLAEDLHDNLGSTIATLKMHFDTYKNLTSKKDSDQIIALNNTSNLLDETYQKVRYMAHTNQVSVMEQHGLITSLKLLTNKLSEAKQLNVEFNHYGFDKKIKSSLELNIFRIIQELITNIIKHAKATKIAIDINMFEDILTIIIEDNGVGFKVNKVLNKNNKGMGLQNLKSRVERENGTFSIESKEGKGTAIIIEIPLINVI